MIVQKLRQHLAYTRLEDSRHSARSRMHFSCFEFPACGGAQPHSPLLRFCTQKVVRLRPPPLLESKVTQMRFAVCMDSRKVTRYCARSAARSREDKAALACFFWPCSFARSFFDKRRCFPPSAPFLLSQGLCNAALQRAARTTGSCARRLCKGSSAKTFSATGCSSNGKKKKKLSMQTARLSHKAIAIHLYACFALKICNASMM